MADDDRETQGKQGFKVPFVNGQATVDPVPVLADNNPAALKFEVEISIFQHYTATKIKVFDGRDDLVTFEENHKGQTFGDNGLVIEIERWTTQVHHGIEFELHI
ncbi:hypothetical protein [Agrobacterium tumefaciens]|uniref:hypothetical protein n=1 Tax=Agrobacterium tumefaciens TaxID=358 RepID=UPI001573CD1A|nr:hypothetical protein [Agrobacterium tumefaciens]